MRVISIDPGVSGAFAVVNNDPDGVLTVEAIFDLPTYSEKTGSGKIRRYVDPVSLMTLLKAQGPVDLIICERLNAPPGIASITAYSMGATAGTISSVIRLAKKTYKLVSPSVWKRALECPADKESARLFASKLFNTDKHWSRKKDHNRAEAALIGAYAILNH